MAQYFAHGLKRWQYSNPVTLGERSALRVVVESNQVSAKPLDKSADVEMNCSAPVLSCDLGLRQEVCQLRPINSEGPRGGCRLSGTGCFARGHRSILADRICRSATAEWFIITCRLQSPSVDPAIVPVSTPTFPGVRKDYRDFIFSAAVVFLSFWHFSPFNVTRLLRMCQSRDDYPISALHLC
jgi:hypothetical protein